YRDALTGYSITAPAGWLMRPSPESKPEESTIVLLDPQVKAFAAIWARKVTGEKAAIPQQLRDTLEERAKSRTAIFKDYKVRPESVQSRQIGTQQALMAIADYMDSDQKMVEYLIFARSENTN